MSKLEGVSSERGDPGDAPSAKDGFRLRLARLARGFSQQELAATAGVTRQAVAGFEAGQWDPSLRVALALARALDTTVEDLFGPASALPPLEAVSLAPLPSRMSRVELGQVGTTTVALPLTGSYPIRAGFLPSDARALAADGDATRCRAHPLDMPRPSLVVAGCDPALPLIRGPLSRLDRPLGLLWWPCGSDEALRLAAAGLVHVAGFHLTAEAAARRARATVRRAGLAEVEIVKFAAWREGLATRPDAEPATSGLGDVVRKKLRFVNREPGAEARRLVDRELERLDIDPHELDGYDTALDGHLSVASAVAARVGDAGVTIEPAALAYDLSFLPLVEELSLLAIPRRVMTTPEVQGLLRVLATPSVRLQLASLPGYNDTASCGARLESAHALRP